MCTLMMLKGWKLRYANLGNNSTFCPEDTEEFMKQRRRWLLSDYANAYVVFKNLGQLMVRNTTFTLFYVVYLLQMFLIMILYPGSTIIMLALGLELVSGIPLVAIVPIFFMCVVTYAGILVSNRKVHVQILLSKVLTIVLGLLTVFVFVSAAIFMAEHFHEGNHFR